jgi:hypothetical protein
MKRHPGKHALFDYAEGLVDRRATISAKIGGHVAGCAICQAEVKTICASLEFGRTAPQLEPLNEFTARLLLAAQNERRVLMARRARRPVAFPVLKGLGYAAGLLVVSALCFGAALGNGSQTTHALMMTANKHAGDTGLSPEAVRKATAEIQALAAAVSLPSKKASVWELERRRAVHALNTDIEAARAALARNPGCQRASRLVDVNLQRQVQTLRDLYVERSL